VRHRDAHKRFRYHQQTKAYADRELEKYRDIVTTNRYLKEYSELLANLNVTVITPDKLTEVLDGNLGE
jgi:hypothetical protein